MRAEAPTAIHILTVAAPRWLPRAQEPAGWLGVVMVVVLEPSTNTYGKVLVLL